MFIIAPYKGRRKCKFSISKKGETGVGGYRVFQNSQWMSVMTIACFPLFSLGHSSPC